MLSEIARKQFIRLSWQFGCCACIYMGRLECGSVNVRFETHHITGDRNTRVLTSALVMTNSCKISKTNEMKLSDVYC